MSSFTLSRGPGMGGYMVAHLRDGGRFETDWASASVMEDWIKRPVFDGVPVTWTNPSTARCNPATCTNPSHRHRRRNPVGAEWWVSGIPAGLSTRVDRGPYSTEEAALVEAARIGLPMSAVHFASEAHVERARDRGAKPQRFLDKPGKRRKNPSGFPMTASSNEQGLKPFRPRQTTYVVLDDVEDYDLKKGDILSPQDPTQNAIIRELKDDGVLSRQSIRAKVLVRSDLDPVTITRQSEGHPGRGPRSRPRSSSLDYTGEIRQATRAMNVWGYETKRDLGQMPTVKDRKGKPAKVLQVSEPDLDIYELDERRAKQADRHSFARARTQIGERRKARGDGPLPAGAMSAGSRPKLLANPKKKRAPSAYTLFVKANIPRYLAAGMPAQTAMQRVAADWRNR